MSMKKRITRERETVQKMIALYCHAHHQTLGGQLCDDCRALSDYAIKRIKSCPFGIRKPTCAQCPIHCYHPDMREKIRKIMRYAGPRMLWNHPRLTFFHMLDRLVHVRKKKR